MNPPFDPALIGQAHALYRRLTGQSLSLRYDRERQWYQVLRAGHTLADVEHLIRYLQREIRATRRQVGALKLSNLLQPDRFEEDLGISRLRLRPPPAHPRSNPPPARGSPCHPPNSNVAACAVSKCWQNCGANCDEDAAATCVLEPPKIGPITSPTTGQYAADTTDQSRTLGNFLHASK